MTTAQAEALGTMQQVLRHLMLSMAVATRADRAVLRDALMAASTNGSITPEARMALANLADCAGNDPVSLG